MTQDEILEGNKLIVKFMGIKNYGMKDLELWVFFPNHSGTPTELLKYHSSWDWLMPVVEKISKWADANIILYTKYFWYDGGINDFLIFRIESIEKLWEAVVEFIMWYNKNKKS